MELERKLSEASANRLRQSSRWKTVYELGTLISHTPGELPFLRRQAMVQLQAEEQLTEWVPKVQEAACGAVKVFTEKGRLQE